MSIKVRFNLASGANFMKWQVKTDEGVQHYDPNSVTLILTGAKLRNQPATAKKIHAGANKSVCAWVDCESVAIAPAASGAAGQPCEYDPRVAPHWRVAGVNADNTTYNQLVSHGRRLYIV